MRAPFDSNGLITQSSSRILRRDHLVCLVKDKYSDHLGVKDRATSREHVENRPGSTDEDMLVDPDSSSPRLRDGKESGNIGILTNLRDHLLNLSGQFSRRSQADGLRMSGILNTKICNLPEELRKRDPLATACSR